MLAAMALAIKYPELLDEPEKGGKGKKSKVKDEIKNCLAAGQFGWERIMTAIRVLRLSTKYGLEVAATVAKGDLGLDEALESRNK